MQSTTRDIIAANLSDSAQSAERTIHIITDAVADAAEKATETARLASESIADAAARAAAASADLIPASPSSSAAVIHVSPLPGSPKHARELLQQDTVSVLDHAHHELFGEEKTSSSSSAAGAFDKRTLSMSMAPSSLAYAERYCAHCRSLSVVPHPGVLVFLRLHLHELAPEPYHLKRHTDQVCFGDADMYAFCDFLLRDRQPSPAFEHWTIANFSGCSLGYTSVQILMCVLTMPACRVHTVDFSHQDIGPRGADALVTAIRANPRITTVKLLGSFIHDAGALQFCQLLGEGREGEDEGKGREGKESHEGRDGVVDEESASLAAADSARRAFDDGLVEHGRSHGRPSFPPQQPHALEYVDLSVNMISYEVVERLQLVRPEELTLVLRGNRVLDEVLNASSHAIGVILAIIGAVFLGVRVNNRPDEAPLGPDGTTPLGSGAYVIGTVLYAASLFMLYLFSTLYHSLFALHYKVVELFTLFDHSAIYLLIAGSYTPFLTILFPDKPIFSTWLLGFLWVMSFLGICLNICYSGKMKVCLQLSTYLGMGWAVLLCFGDMVARLSPHPEALWLLVGGGVSYTVGVPWFIRDKRFLGVPDHTIWHLFVLNGSLMHFLCVYHYIVTFPYEGVPAPWAMAGASDGGGMAIP